MIIRNKTVRKILGLPKRKPQKPRSSDPLVDQDELFARIFAACKPFTMTSKTRMYALYKAVEYVIHGRIPGDFVECGVWKGGSAMVIAHTLLALNVTDRKIYLYDTFEGMTRPTEDDQMLADAKVNSDEWWQREQKESHNEWCYASLTEVEQNTYSTGYPKQNFVFVKGKVEDTLPATLPQNIAILRLDTDWYESTKHELVHLYPHVSTKGVLIVDDYGYWSGSKKAVDEYFLKEPILLNRIDPSGRIGIKVQ